MKSTKRQKAVRTPTLRVIKRVVTKAVRKPKPKKLAQPIGPLVFDEKPLVEQAPPRAKGPQPLTLGDAIEALGRLADDNERLYLTLVPLYNLVIRMERESALRLPYPKHREVMDATLKTLRGARR